MHRADNEREQREYKMKFSWQSNLIKPLFRVRWLTLFFRSVPFVSVSMHNACLLTRSRSLFFSLSLSFGRMPTLQMNILSFFLSLFLSFFFHFQFLLNAYEKLFLTVCVSLYKCVRVCV